MMKQVNIRNPFRMLILMLGLFLSVGAFAQIDVKGHVKDAQGEPVIGATVRVVGTQTATVTDFDGNFAGCRHHRNVCRLPRSYCKSCSQPGDYTAGGPERS